MIRFNEKSGKYEGLVNGKVVSIASTKEKVEKTLEAKYGVTSQMPVAGEVPQKKTCEFSVEERFQFIEQFTKLVAKKIVPSYIITGSGGIGKTTTVINTLTDIGMKEDAIGSMNGDYITFKGYSTAKALYRMFYENNGKLFIFDDADNIFKDPIAANILKAALDSNDKRVISWGAETRDEDLPSRFEFYGRVIFISNLPLTKFPQALVSRSLLTDLTLNTEETVSRIEYILGSVNCEEEERSDTIQFIKKYATSFSDLNVRSGMTVLKLRKALGNSFERIALYTISAGAGA